MKTETAGPRRWPSATQVFTNPVLFLAFGAGTGLSRKAPGTVGTLIAVPLFLLLHGLPLAVYAGITAVGFIAGVWICGQAARQVGVEDHPGIVWDEIIGYLVTMTLAGNDWLSVVLGFALFRLFDITKPFPIRTLDRRCPGGFGIMVDDLLAGIFAAVCLGLVMRLL